MSGAAANTCPGRGAGRRFAPVSRSPLERVRKYTWWTLVGATALIGLLAIADIARVGFEPLRTAVLGVCAATTLVLYVRVTGSALPGLGRAPRRWEEPLMLVASLAGWWSAMATMGDSPVWSLLPASALSAMTALRRGVVRWVATWVGTAVIVGSGLVVARWAGTPMEPVAWSVAVSIMTLIFVVSNLLQVWLWAMVREIDRARHVAGELAVAQERLRFASDLHDIQGHHLQAIALKAELAERLIGHDDDAARAQAAEVGALARTALQETRDVVRGYRRAGLSTEIGNAVQILRAAGIDADVAGDAAAVPPPLQPLFGALVREGTTNVLRHSAASACTLSVTAASGRVRVELTNDGVDPDRPALGDGTGLDGLRERFATVGGSVRTAGAGGRFHLIGEARTAEGATR